MKKQVKLIIMVILAVSTVCISTGCGKYWNREDELKTFNQHMDVFETLREEAAQMEPNNAYGTCYSIEESDKRWRPEVWNQNATISQIIEDYDIMNVHYFDNGWFVVRLNREPPQNRWGSFQYITKEEANENRRTYDFKYRLGDTFYTDLWKSSIYYGGYVCQHITGNWFYVEQLYERGETPLVKEIMNEIIPNARSSSFEEFYALLE